MIAPRYSNPPEQLPLVDRSVAYKTVATFSGITKRRLFLKSGNKSQTDGTLITVPFSDPNYYQKIEHEIAHVLFKSDGLAKDRFVSEYVDLVTRHAEAQGSEIQRDRLSFLLSSIVGVLEDYRVNGLWGCLYPGSFELIQEMVRVEAERLLPRAHRSFLYFMVCVYADCDIPDGIMSPFRDIISEAFDRVSKRGFGATLVTAKWLIIQLVNVLIESSGIGPVSKYTPGRSKGDADPEKRLTALKQLSELLLASDEPLSEVINRFDEFDDLRKPRFVNVADGSIGIAKEALKFDPKNEGAFEKLLEGSRVEMERLLEEVRSRLRVPLQHEDWIQQNSKAKILFQDVSSADVEIPTPFTPDDQGSVNRLRALFTRVKGRSSQQLAVSGSRIDIPSYIERRLTGEETPCFYEDTSARGFRCLILLDRSSSMNGVKTRQAERACRILTRSLKYPFVEFEVWGFQAVKGQVLISRFEKGLESFTSDKSLVVGQTPLHIAIRTAARHILQPRTINQIFVITDGLPIYDSNGQYITVDDSLILATGYEVRSARSKGIRVTGLVISKDAKPTQLFRMFGRSWRYVDVNSIGSDVVRTVSDSFVSYLKNV